MQQELNSLSQSNPSALDLASIEATLQALAEMSGPSDPSGPGPSAGKAKGSDLLSEEFKYRSLVDCLPAVVFMASLDGGRGDAYVSPQVEATLGYTQAEWLEDPLRWYQQIHPDDKERWSAEAAEMFALGTPLKSVYRVIARDGRVVWFQCEAGMLRTQEGRPYAIHGVGFDITKLKESEQALSEKNKQLELLKEEAEAASRAKSVFLSTVSHEIRTPMNAILGCAQLMSRDPELGSNAKANLKTICQSGEHLIGLITDILDMSKIEAGRTELNPTTLNVSQLVESLALMFCFAAQAKSLQFDVSVEGEYVAYVVADAGKIRQVLINLLGNAIKFTPRGQIKLHVTLQRKAAGQLWLSFQVQDTGPGISDEEQGKLFQPFHQMKRGQNAQEGTGLGLAIGRSYARLMGGDITVTSSLSQGSIFLFEIPVEPGEVSTGIGQIAPYKLSGLDHGMLAALSVSSKQLASLPLELIDQLQNAVQEGEKDRLDELIQSVQAYDKNAAAGLKNYAENYEYDDLTVLLTEAQQRITKHNP